jgi:tripartite-type tricarboxylate transporter receptor subunit TctC
MKKIARRKFLHLAAASPTLSFLPRAARAQSYPTRPIRLIVQVPPGGSPDIVARVMGQWLSEKLGQPVVVDNRPGASGNIATEFVTKATPDGYTLLLSMSSNAINASLYQHLNFNFMQDTAPVASISLIPLVMDINPGLPVKSVPEFINYVKANPGKVNLAASGVGTPLYVAGALFKMMTGLTMLDVNYQGEAAAMPDLLSGQVQAMFGVMPASLGYIKSGQLRPLAVTSQKRQEMLPDVPAMAEFVPGYEASGWYGVSAPKGTPADIVQVLNKQVNAGLADPGVRKRLDDLGCNVFSGSPDDFGKFVAAETDKWAKVIKFANIKVD